MTEADVFLQRQQPATGNRLKHFFTKNKRKNTKIESDVSLKIFSRNEHEVTSIKVHKLKMNLLNINKLSTMILLHNVA